jgi:hypothetical protein
VRCSFVAAVGGGSYGLCVSYLVFIQDHDDCGGASDRCYSQTGLQMYGDRAIVYGLFVEHEMGDLTQWFGNNGTVFLYQSELPYHFEARNFMLVPRPHDD